MRHASRKSVPRRPLVGILVDSADTFGRSILRGVMRYANMQRRWLLFADLQRTLDKTTHWPSFDGVICASLPADIYNSVVEKYPCLVSCSGGMNPKITPVVTVDGTATGAMGAEHLLGCQLERFAFYGRNPAYSIPVQRFEGFRNAVEGKGCNFIECPLLRPTAQDWASHAHRPALIAWLRALPKPIGIMAFDDFCAHDLAGACLEADIGVPDHVAIVGVNNDDLLCESAWPPLSSVEADFSRLGYAAAGVLDRLLRGEVLAKKERLLLLPPLGIVQRQSTDIIATGDPDLANAIRFIREHACDPCSVHDVLAAVPVGRRWLERQFVSRLDRTPHEEIARVRVETAKRLLRQSALSIQDVAGRCGFAELKSFYLAFRRAAGTSPAAYRRMALFGTR